MPIPEYMMPADQREALRRLRAGEQLNFSTAIDGYITYGYGNLDECGFWEFPLRWEYLTHEQKIMVVDLEAR
jgi:hypothetical protein